MFPQVEMLPDIAHAPRILPTYTQHIPAALKKVHAHPRGEGAWVSRLVGGLEGAVGRREATFLFHRNVLSLLQDLDNYIRTRAPVTFLSELRGHLQVCMSQRSSLPCDKYT